MARFADRSAVADRLREEGQDGGGSEEVRDRGVVLAGLEEAFDRFRERVVTPEAIRAQLAARHEDWVRVAGSCVDFATEPTAREAALCVRDDGEAPADVTARAGVAVRLVRLDLCDRVPG